MGRKGKKRVLQPARTPVRTPTNLSVHEAPSGIEAAAVYDAQAPPVIEDQQDLPEPETMSIEPSPQLSPPPSPIREDLHAERDEAPATQRIQPALPRTRRTDSFVQIESPPVSPPLRPVSPVRRQNAKQPVVRDARPSQASFEAYGTNPHVVACISCNDFCTLTGARGVVAKQELGLDESNDDTFLPTVCSTCENERGLKWLRMYGGRSPPDQRHQHPETLHSSMLASWPLYVAARRRFGVTFDEAAQHWTTTVTRARDWWREGVLTSDKSLVLMWRFDTERGKMYERNPMPRKDEFFGGPQR